MCLCGMIGWKAHFLPRLVGSKKEAVNYFDWQIVS